MVIGKGITSVFAAHNPQRPHAMGGSPPYGSRPRCLPRRTPDHLLGLVGGLSVAHDSKQGARNAEGEQRVL